MGANIIQLSLTVPETADINAAIATANGQGVLIICAAGNTSGPVTYPARRPETIAVGGTLQNDGKAGIASFGVDLDISAPAVDILSTRPGNAYNTSSGTSFAAPQVSAAAALLLSRNPCLNNDQIKEIFQFSADKVGGYNYNWNPAMPGHSLELGYGRLNLRAALTNQATLDIDVTQNTNYNTGMVINGNIFVRTGAQLTITSTLQFAKDKGIIVERGAKLHVNGGTLTKCPDGEDWRGINVEGNASLPQPDAFSMPAANEAGVVLINNLAHVEWARTAISTTFYNEGWNSPYWGGLIHCENATFLTNGRVAEFMKYDLPNQSIFINCTMDADGVGNVGVTIWDTDNVTFNRCRFYNMGSQGILTFDAGAIVKDGNDFLHNRRGISSRATYPYSASLEVGDLASDPNYFLDNWFHIESNASNFGPGLSIINNEFFESNTAIWLIGPSRFTIGYNSFDQTTGGIYTSQTGAMGWNQHNYIRNNAISASSGIIASGLNQRLQFLCNDFSARWDFSLRQGNNGNGPQGEIRQQQGSFLNAAGNCFTNPVQNADIRTVNQTLYFRYYVASEEPCKTPVTPGNYDVFPAIDNDPCGGEGGFPDNPTHEDYVTIKGQIVAIQNNGGQPEDELSNLLELKDHILDKLVESYIEGNDTESAILLLDEENTVASRLMKYGVQMNSGDFTAATATLDALPDEVEEVGTFRQIQYINIDRLQQGLEYEMPQSDSLFLESVADSEMGVKGYARAILGLLFGREFDDGLEEGEEGVTERGSQPRQDLAVKETAKVLIYPNPAVNEFTIVLDNDVPAVSLKVSSVMGQAVHNSQISIDSPTLTISTDGWNNGMYILQLFDNRGKIIHAELLVINK
jgi:Subtilase family/Secretion system C-terminal sorting domain